MRIEAAILLVVLLTGVCSKDPLAFVASPFPQNRLFVYKRGRVNISCQTNDKLANVTLTMNPKLDEYNFKQYDQDFVLEEASIHDTSKYSCHATNGHESISMTLGDLHVSRLACRENLFLRDKLKIIKQEILMFEKNENISINCLAEGFAGRISHPLSWWRGNTKFTSNRQHYQFINNTRHDVEKLNITSAQSKDAGLYSCVRNVSGCRDSDVTKVSVELKWIEPFKAKFLNFSATGRTTVGSNYTLSCVVNASPTPNMFWSVGNKVIKSCNYQRSCILMLTHVTKKDEATYSCTAKNTEGIVKDVHKLSILVLPVIKESEYNASKGRILTCKVIKGDPKPFVYWEKSVACGSNENCKTKWANLSADTSYEMVDNKVKGTYELKSLDISDHGTFRCVAVNIAGNNYAQLILRKGLANSASNDSKSPVVGIVLGLLFICLLFFVIFLCYRKYMLKKYALYMAPDPKFHIDPDRTLFEQSIELPYDPEWEFPRERLELIRNLGSGAFGQVWLAHAKGILALSPRDKDTMAIRRRTRLRLNKKVPKTLLNCFLDDDLCEQSVFVAVKTLKANPSDVEYKDLASEIKVLIHLGNHDNIVNILGACTRGGNLGAIMDFCPHGNLVHFLRDRRDIFSLQWAKQADSYEEDFCFFDAAHVALQIARGMAFLSEKKVVHRDLAARNVLVGSDYVIKIADFGLARDIYLTDFYLKESSGMLPVKWMAPESLFDKLYTVKSDVWSFGIVLWEICTMGGSPYPGLPMENLFEYLQAGHRMEKPATCPDELYNIMIQCWKENRCERPFFHELTSQLENIIQSKIVITNNLATFERLKSCSDETDYLVPKSPAKKKKGSLDTMLNMKGLFPVAMYRKKSAGNIVNFPPMEETVKKEEEEQSDPVCENRYVDLRTPTQDENKNDNLAEWMKPFNT